MKRCKKLGYITQPKKKKKAYKYPSSKRKVWNRTYREKVKVLGKRKSRALYMKKRRKKKREEKII